ncbi:sialic acid synthase [Chrysoperla carnea]|uniref:sialic acid synthase n=1 Tax=Chrysoperla carnea TaxID=189513 RepID=UPI001D066283|nr:sialic acid synthase [Chrysoperla carnea]
MSSFQIEPNSYIDNNSQTYFIAEIGQNHQGNVELAKKLILAAKKSGANCVKFQKSDLNMKFTQKALERPYKNKNSWGNTYGEHKQHLEFTIDEYLELIEYAKSLNIPLTASAMDINSVDILCDQLNVPFLKIGSGDANNFPLIEHAAKKNVPLVISTGMQNIETVQKIYEIVTNYHKNFVLMHCVSAYPLPAEDINLKVIQLYQKMFPDILIGYSGHELNSDCTIAAVTLGAKIIERHFTLNHFQNGSDHQCSLTPTTFSKMVSRVRNLETMLGISKKSFQISELSCAHKLGKSIVMKRSQSQGHILNEDDLVIKVSEPLGINGCELYNIIGKQLKIDLNADSVVLLEYLK